MKPQHVFALSVVICLGVISAIVLLASGHSPTLLNPKGLVAEKELALMFDVVLLMLIVAIAVFALAFSIAWRYRAGNKKAEYQPNWGHGALNELVWWAIPIEIVLVLGALTWTSTHDLDPGKALSVSGTPLTVQVVALPSTWLFIYPEQHIATVNQLTLPIKRPVTFKITSDAPMNSFWIPELGGQMYAMTGMSTELNVIADQSGTFEGRSANYSGEAFASMHFTATATSEADFYLWVESTQRSPLTLSSAAYEELRNSPAPEAPLHYGRVAEHLYDTIVMKFMPGMPPHSH